MKTTTVIAASVLLGASSVLAHSGHAAAQHGRVQKRTFGKRVALQRREDTIGAAVLLAVTSNSTSSSSSSTRSNASSGAVSNSTLAAANATTVAVAVNETEAVKTYNGTALWFIESGEKSACYTTHTDEDLVVGLSKDLWPNTGVVSDYCGQYLTIFYKDRNVTALISDASGNQYTTLTKAAFLKLSPLREGMINITYQFGNGSTIGAASASAAVGGTTKVASSAVVGLAADVTPSVKGAVPTAEDSSSTKTTATAARETTTEAPKTTATPKPTTSAFDQASYDRSVSAASRSAASVASAEAAASASAAAAQASKDAAAAKDAAAEKAAQEAAASASASASAAAASASAKAQAQADAKAQAEADAKAKAEAEAQAASDAAAASSAAAAASSKAAAAAAASKASAEAAAAAAKPTSAPASDSKVYSGGYATYYFQNGVAGNCGTVAQDSDYVIALPTATYANGAHCGAKVKITRGDKSVIGTVRDSCPSCVNNSCLDLSESLFKAIASTSEGMVPITWQFV